MKVHVALSMAVLLAGVGGCTMGAQAGAAAEEEQATETTEKEAPRAKGPVIDHELETLEGEPFSLAAQRGKVLLLVNVASNCGYTPQYEGLQKLHEIYGEKGLVVVGIPSNDFGGQEPGSAEEIRAFCESRYDVSFPMMAKVHAKGPDMAPLYRALTEQTAPPIAGEVKWNFTKFLVDKEGRPVARFEPKVEPLAPEVIRAIEALL